MKKLFSVFLVALFFGSAAQAQFQYNFTHYTAPYSALSDSILLNYGMIWDDETYAITLPFPFTIQNQPVTNLAFTTDAILMSPTGLSTADAFALTSFDLVDKGYFVGSSMSPIRFEVTGNAPNRIAKIEMANAGFYDDTITVGAIDYFNLQLWLYENSNIVEFRYGPSQVTQFDAYGSDEGMLCGFADELYLDSENLNKLYLLSGNPAQPILDSSVTIHFAPSLNAWPANGTVYRFTPLLSGGGDTSTGVSHLTARQGIGIFPNPAHDEVRLTLPNTSGTLVLVNAQGQVVHNQKVSGGKTTLSIAAMPAGMYLVSYTDEQGNVATSRFMKQ